MEAVLVIVVVVAGVLFQRRRDQRRASAHADVADVAGVARLRHLRSGEYPSSCTWCKDTALSRKLIMFERTPESWRVEDVMTRLAECRDDEVVALASALQRDVPRWRRICSERCAREFLSAEHVTATVPFVSCEYCSVRAPATLLRCPNCGAMRGGM